MARKVEIAKQKRVEIAAENKRAIEQKKLVLKREQDEDAQVVAYQKAKAIETARIEKEKEDKKQAAALLCAKLRSQQQRAMDNRSEMDELRAKRYQEEHERKQRAREMSEEEHRKETLKMMQDARVAQQNMKKYALAA